MSDYRDRLAEARKSAKLTCRQLGELIGCGASTISRVERHGGHVAAPIMIAWAHACAVSLDRIADLGPLPLEGLGIELEDAL